jgi:ubiquinone/menaquinone biosynthesis C-methylase UbiE
MTKRVERVPVREGYDLWARSYDSETSGLKVLDRKHTLAHVDAKPNEWILDAGCGTGAHLRLMQARGANAVGLDFSTGMLMIAKQHVPRPMFVQADLNDELPVRQHSFDAFVSALVSEHLTDLRRFFGEASSALRRGGRLIFSAFHPEPARAGVEANFEEQGTEYRLGAEPYTTDEYLNHIADARFTDIVSQEFIVDDSVIAEAPAAAKHKGAPMLLLVTAARP